MDRPRRPDRSESVTGGSATGAAAGPGTPTNEVIRLGVRPKTHVAPVFNRWKARYASLATAQRIAQAWTIFSSGAA
jgi:hypothetical protein